MEIIRYTDKYKKQIINLIIGIQNDENHLGFTVEEQPELADPNLFEQHDGVFWIAVENEEVIGTIGVMPYSETTAVFKKFFIRKDYRGTGLSDKLYSKLLKFAIDKGMKHIILDTPSILHRAHHFYEKNGYRIISSGELPVSYSYPDRDCLLYMLDL